MEKMLEYLLPKGVKQPALDIASAYAPTNIALCKYWGKRDVRLNLPETSSLSITLPNFGVHTVLRIAESARHIIIVNGVLQSESSDFYVRVAQFLNLFCQNHALIVETNSNIPISAGLASSAAGFAAIVKALDKLYAWGLSLEAMSILARLGSGSACRSFWQGFVEWQAGVRADGFDSHGVPFACRLPGLNIGLLVLDTAAKTISSRVAMQYVKESPFFISWKSYNQDAISAIKNAILAQELAHVGRLAEDNALKLHALILSSKVMYFKPETISVINKIWQLRKDGLEVYFTQDAGPNIKLIFDEQDAHIVKQEFPHVIVTKPFQIEDNLIVLVNEHDESLGVADKMLVHEAGALHRAVSVVLLRVVDGYIEILLQQRNVSKYHAATMWANACCGHPRQGESMLDAAKRRLEYELGITTAELKFIGTMIYREELDNNLTEHELDHVFIGIHDAEVDFINYNHEEVMALKWVRLDELKNTSMSVSYAPWLKHVLRVVINNMAEVKDFLGIANAAIKV